MKRTGMCTYERISLEENAGSHNSADLRKVEPGTPCP